MRRIKYTLTMDVIADDDQQFAQAENQLRLVSDYLGQIPPAALTILPTSAVTGRAGGASPGWMCVIKIEENE